MANIELRKQILDHIINFTDRATAFAQTINVREVVSRLSEVAMTATNVGMQIASTIASVAEGAGILPGAGAFMTLASCAVQGATTIGQAFLPSIITVLENGVVPNLGYTIRERLIQRRAALETGEKVDFASGLQSILAAAWEDIKLIGASALGGVSSVDTGSLLGMTDDISSSVGTIIDSVQSYTNKLATLRDDYMTGVGSDQMNTAINNIYNTTNDGVSKVQQLIGKIEQIVGIREETDKQQASRVPAGTKVGSTIVISKDGSVFGYVKSINSDGSVVLVDTTGNEVTVAASSDIWTGLKIKDTGSGPNGTIVKNEATNKVPVNTSGLSQETLLTLEANIGDRTQFEAPKKAPIAESVMVRYKDNGELDNYFANVWKVNNDGTFTVYEVVGHTPDGQDVQEERTYKVSDFTNSNYSFYKGKM